MRASEVEALKLASPEYTAVMVFDPFESCEVVRMANEFWSFTGLPMGSEPG